MFACQWSIEPIHDWTVRIAGNRYGVIQQFEGGCRILCGGRGLSLDMPACVVAGALLGLAALGAFLAVKLIGVPSPHRPA